MKIQLTNSIKPARVDREDYDFLMHWKWTLTPDGYAARISSTGKIVYMHEEVMRRKIRDSN